MASLTDAGVPLSRSAVARYIQLATLFRSRIMSGQWAAGGQIPTIEQLMAECGVARATIRQALGLLEDEGLDIALSRQGHVRHGQGPRPCLARCDDRPPAAC